MARVRERGRGSEKLWRRVSDTRVFGEENHESVDCGEDKGWTTVGRKHRYHTVLNEGTIFTLFVDNIPESKDQSWLVKAFNMFGKVRDAFLPTKRSKRTGQKFGFVRYDCSKSAEMAISKMSGIWVDNNRLFVKEACFGETNPRGFQNRSRIGVEEQSKKRGIPDQGKKERMVKGKEKIEVCREYSKDGPSFLQVLKGEGSKGGMNGKIMVKTNQDGCGWLYRSAIAVMQRVVSMTTLVTSFKRASDSVAQFRSLGGRSVIITFQSQEVRDIMLKNNWMKLWFEKVAPWKGETASLERFVWLSCRGVPLHGWNVTLFVKIAEVWGKFVLLDEQTLNGSSFCAGKVLIATEKRGKIDEWIKVIVGESEYEVKVEEITSFGNPDEVEALNFQQQNAMQVGGLNGTGEATEKGARVAGKEMSGSGKGGDAEVARGGKISNRKEGVGEEGDRWSEKGDGGGDQRSTGEHLMGDVSLSPVRLRDFESNVGELGGFEMGKEKEILGLSAHSVISIRKEEEAQRRIAKRGEFDGPESDMLSRVEDTYEKSPIRRCNGKENGGKGLEEDWVSRVEESKKSGSSEPTEPNYLEETTDGEEDNPTIPSCGGEIEGGAGSGAPAEICSVVPRASQMPGINILVDLNNAEGRKKRRRQLLSVMSGEREGEDASADEGEFQASLQEIRQSNSSVLREVNATLEVGRQLGIEFLPKDLTTLQEMVESEAQDYLAQLEKEAGH